VLGWRIKPTTRSCGVCSWRPKAAMRSLSCFARRIRRARSPAALRLQLHADAEQVDIEILKCRGNLDWQRPIAMARVDRAERLSC
jgi:hypothetical protein